MCSALNNISSIDGPRNFSCRAREHAACRYTPSKKSVGSTLSLTQFLMSLFFAIQARRRDYGWASEFKARAARTPTGEIVASVKMQT
jgi:hypothetical protein